MRLSTEAFKTLVRLKSLGRKFRVHDARKAGAKQINFCRYMGEKGLLKREPRSHLWELTDKADEEIKAMHKLLEQVK